MALKIGSGDRKKVAIAGGLAVVALVLAARTIFGGPDTPPAPTARAVPVSTLPSSSGAPSSSGSTTGASGNTAATAAQLDPTLHPELMAENENFVYNGNGRNIFSLNSVPTAMVKIEQPRGPIRPVQAVYTPPPGPPPPPNIDLRFFGYSARRDGTRKAFLLHGDDVFIAAEGDVVSHRYRVVRIAPTSVTVEDLPYHNSQSLPLVQN